MYVLITYDVNTSSEQGEKRLRNVAKCCKDYGIRVQNSVFECMLDESKYLLLKAKLLTIIDNTVDTIRLYKLGNNHHNKIEHLGRKTGYDLEGELII